MACQLFQISLAYVDVLSLLLGSPFLSFFFLVCASSGVLASIRQHFSCLPIVLFCRTVCCYMWLSFFLLAFLFVCSRFRASTAFLAVRLPGLVFLGGFLSFSSFRLRFFPLRDAIFRLLVCALCIRLLLPCFSVIEFLFSFFFCIQRSHFRCFASSFVHPSSVFHFITRFDFPFVLPVRRSF